MRRAGGSLPEGRQGYTIIEVLIVLAISASILFVAISVFAGKNNSTLFSQGMQDLASKIKVYTNQVTSGMSPDTSGYRCDTSSGHAWFYQGSGNTSNCLFLGKALLVSPTPANTISVYTIVGTRNSFSGGVDTGRLAQSFEQTNPTTARICIGADCDPSAGDLFVDRYSLNNSLQIISSKILGQSGSYGLIGAYTDLGGTSASETSGSTGLLTKAYPYTGDSSGVKACIEGGGACASPINNFSQWQLCVQNGSNSSQRALLNINASASSLTTEINYQNCA
jgi:prepilin-type N-terminal cleavage/methylation domain-containing protein